mmetsp:Transcript_8340/g.20476  ORF Transcript_8340/g.20476 Transcript_8340/m.20476 type:complete len:257 (+) Transcript_8340:1-771(+)
MPSSSLANIARSTPVLAFIAATAYSLCKPPWSFGFNTVCSSSSIGGGGSKAQAHAFAPTPLRHNKRREKYWQDRSPLSSSTNDSDEEEWRTFRARLIQNGLPSLENANYLNDDNTTPKADTKKNNNLRYAHECTPLVEVGSVLLSIPTTDLCQGVEQQYWHRAVVLITKVSENVVNGEMETDVPEEQLARGLKRGRWSYRGLLLNRCTNSGDCDDDERSSWRLQRGGDLLGLDSSDGTEFVCLHNFDDGLEDEDVR